MLLVPKYPTKSNNIHQYLDTPYSQRGLLTEDYEQGIMGYVTVLEVVCDKVDTVDKVRRQYRQGEVLTPSCEGF